MLIARVPPNAPGAAPRSAEPISNGRQLLQAAGGSYVGIDERRRDRQGRTLDLGGRTLRREQLRGSGDRQDVAARSRAEIRPVGETGQELRRRYGCLRA